MLIRRGIAVSPGVAIAPAMLLGIENFRIPQRLISTTAVPGELSRFHAAMEAVRQEIQDNEQLARERLGDQYAAIFSAHLMMARDLHLISEIEGRIQGHQSAEYAASQVLRQYSRRLQDLGGQYMSDRSVEISDLEKRLLRLLLGEQREELSQLTSPIILLANNLTPSETANIDRRFVLGFATEVGGYTSHTAILAGALEIPAVVGVGKFLDDVSGAETVIIDGSQGVIIIDPDDITLVKYRNMEVRFRNHERRLHSQRELPCETQDGVSISVMGNIEFPTEAEPCREKGAAGVGLYRTEFLYLESNREPTEEDHYRAYCQVLKAFPEQPVVIRTLDLGSDKLPSSLRGEYSASVNPALSIRSIRLSLQQLQLFKTQLRAVLRAAVLGDLRIMFPLISTLLEFRQARMVLGDVIDDLEEQGVPFRRDVPVGMMVEVPAAAIMAEEFASEVDFFSLGTNDLIQYTLAVDRADQGVAYLYREGDPSILRLIRMVVNAARKYDIPVCVCGQMSTNPLFLPLLVGLGIRQISVTPHAIPELKELIRKLTIEKAEKIATHAGEIDVARDVESYLRRELKKLCPELFDSD